MTLHAGKDLVLKISDGQSPAGFLPVTGFSATSISLRTETVEATHLHSPGWREQVPGAGLNFARLTARGLFTTNPGMTQARKAFFDGQAPDWQVTLPGIGQLAGPFRLTRFDLTGPYAGEVQAALTLQSAGKITLTEE
ncbi:phage tail protein [Parvularcula sp. IMCC14364]|uniref:phage tail protein n=1 Tax=Parvularcula sp. IMCC14364 TaxID=3067902 RepID=UPI002740B66B|nr:phage tail protein [Parvularcula sp. IMCC14364]